MGSACSAYGGGERRVHGFGAENCGKEPLGKPRRRWKDNIQIIFMKWDMRLWTGSSWLRIGTGGGHLWMQ